MQLRWSHLVAALVIGSTGTAGLFLMGYLYYKERSNREESVPKEEETTPKDVYVTTPPRTDENSKCPDYKHDGVVLYCDEDRQEVLNLTAHLRKYSSVPHLSLDVYDALPLAGKTQFDCMGYVLSHCRFIFIYVSPNLTKDKLLKFQAQMCLLDVIKKEEWRVIPVWADKSYDTYCPSELTLLHGFGKWEISRVNSSTNKLAGGYLESKFDRCINDGRARLS